MILVDTNVVSEVMKVAPSETVVTWFNNQKSSSLYISTITIGEIEYGLRILPAGKRRMRLKERSEIPAIWSRLTDGDDCKFENWSTLREGL